jgi:hypothetical protein
MAAKVYLKDRWEYYGRAWMCVGHIELLNRVRKIKGRQWWVKMLITLVWGRVSIRFGIMFGKSSEWVVYSMMFWITRAKYRVVRGRVAPHRDMRTWGLSYISRVLGRTRGRCRLTGVDTTPKWVGVKYTVEYMYGMIIIICKLVVYG